MREVKQSSVVRIFLLIGIYPRDSEICDDAVVIYHPRVRTLKELLYADGAECAFRRRTFVAL